MNARIKRVKRLLLPLEALVLETDTPDMPVFGFQSNLTDQSGLFTL